MCSVTLNLFLFVVTIWCVLSLDFSCIKSTTRDRRINSARHGSCWTTRFRPSFWRVFATSKYLNILTSNRFTDIYTTDLLPFYKFLLPRIPYGIIVDLVYNIIFEDHLDFYRMVNCRLKHLHEFNKKH